ncbi:MAG: T9SS type A sorting domain-containing protein [candidate division Zixibacteria bacterium]|nr:T9SS type A sorting domain-containing protein [candidate division Zixibacteria bacterium]
MNKILPALAGVLMLLMMPGLFCLPLMGEDIQVSLPDTVITRGDTARLAVTVDEITSSHQVFSYDAEIAYDSSLIKIIDIDKDGSLSSGSFFAKNTKDTSFFVACASGSLIYGSGVLFWVELTVKENAPGGSVGSLEAIQAKFNEGNPPSQWLDGAIETFAVGPYINCPDTQLDMDVCEGQQACIELVINDYTDVTVSRGTWQNDTLCFTPDQSGTYDFSITASDGTTEVECDFSAEINLVPHVNISVDEINLDTILCSPGQVCLDLPITGQSEVAVEYGDFENDEFCFSVDTGGLYEFTLVASNQCYSDTCQVTADVTIYDQISISCPTITDTFLCAPGLICLDFPIDQQTKTSVNFGSWSSNQFCFNADTSGVYSFVVAAENDCYADTCWFALEVTVYDEIEIQAPAEVIDTTLFELGELCLDLPIVGYDSVYVSTGSFNNGQLCLEIVDSGTYQIDISAVSQCGRDSASITLNVKLAPEIIMGCPTDLDNIYLIEEREVKIPLPIRGHDQVIISDTGASWINDSLRFTPHQDGNYFFEVTASNNGGDEVTCEFDCYVEMTTDFDIDVVDLEGSFPQSAQIGDSIPIEIAIESNTNFLTQMDVRNFKIKILFDPVCVDPHNMIKGPMTDYSTWDDYQMRVDTDTVIINMNSSDPLNGNGILFNLEAGFIVQDTNFSNSTNLKVVSFETNAGDPNIIDGLGTVTLHWVSDVTAYDAHVVPEDFELMTNYPNPFNAGTTISFAIARETHVAIDILNIRGQKVTTLVNQVLGPGYYETSWDGKSTDGRTSASGMYFYRMTTDEKIESRKMIMLK